MLYGILILLIIFCFVLYKVSIESRIKTKVLNIKWQSSWGDKKFSYYDSFLTKHNTYYRDLTYNGKKKFVKRTYNFIQDISFYGKKGIEVTDEIKIIISGAAIQLTFGHKDYLFERFQYIFVYPDPFYSKVYKQYLKGGTYPMGVIALSWEHFKFGYENTSDGINLGLHEMAHTMLLQLSDDQFETYIDDWFTISRKEFLNIKGGSSTMFRSYAGTNRHEFLAVAIECFFEKPTEFKERLPNIYNGLKILLNQDPLNRYNNFKLEDVENKITSLKMLAKKGLSEKYI